MQGHQPTEIFANHRRKTKKEREKRFDKKRKRAGRKYKKLN